MSQTEPAEKSNRLIYVIGSLFFVGLLAGWYLIPSRCTSNLINGMIIVPAGGYRYFRFTVPAGASDVHVKGSFWARGGLGDDIKVTIMDDAAFTNWKSGRPVSVFYNSGILTKGDFDVILSPGQTYCLVYSNDFSILFGKNVNTSVDVTYWD